MWIERVYIRVLTLTSSTIFLCIYRGCTINDKKVLVHHCYCIIVINHPLPTIPNASCVEFVIFLKSYKVVQLEFSVYKSIMIGINIYMSNIIEFGQRTKIIFNISWHFAIQIFISSMFHYVPSQPIPTEDTPYADLGSG